jgi:phage-related protein
MPMSDADKPKKQKQKPAADKPLFWMGSSLKDLSAFPLDVKKVMGFALRQAQRGGKHVSVKPLKGQSGASVLELVEDYETDTYRGIYTVRFKRAVYVLHAFKKKSKSGIKTPKQETDRVAKRLKAAEEHYENWLARQTAEEQRGGD